MIDFSDLKINWDTFTYVNGCRLYKFTFDKRSYVNLPEVLEDLSEVSKVNDNIVIDFELPVDKLTYVAESVSSMNLLYSDWIVMYKLINPIYSINGCMLSIKFDKLKCYRFFIDYSSIAELIDWNSLKYDGDTNDLIIHEVKEFPDALNRVLEVTEFNKVTRLSIYPPQDVLNDVYKTIVNHKSLTLIDNINNTSVTISNLHFDRINDLRNISGNGRDLYIAIDGTRNE